MHRMYETLAPSRRQRGGVGLLEPLHQHSALQLRWLEPLLRRSLSSTFMTNLLVHHLVCFERSSIVDARFLLVSVAC